MREAVISQTRDGVGNGDGGQTAAITEAPNSQTHDGVGNGDRFIISVDVILHNYPHSIIVLTFTL